MPPLHNATQQKTGEPFAASPVKIHSGQSGGSGSMTSYGGMIRIRCKGRSSGASSQPAITDSPVFLVLSACILHPLGANCKRNFFEELYPLANVGESVLY